RAQRSHWTTRMRTMVYVAWANNASANNENILVADSTDGGSAYVTWYDRRAGTVTNNDLTDYFAASAGLSEGNLVANNDEFKISTTSDPQCTMWPRGTPVTHSTRRTARFSHRMQASANWSPRLVQIPRQTTAAISQAL